MSSEGYSRLDRLYGIVGIRFLCAMRDDEVIDPTASSRDKPPGEVNSSEAFEALVCSMITTASLVI